MNILSNKLKQLASNKFIRNMGWLTGAELVNRVLRLGVVVFLARLLSSYDYGLVAIVLTTNEFTNVFTLRAGIGSKLIQANEADLPILCQTAYCMNWLLGIALFLTQCFVSFAIARIYDSSQLILPICVISLTYLVFPNYAIQAALIQRENRLHVTALCSLLHSVVGNVFTVILALMGTGMWAIILPILLTSPIWLVINLMNHSWRPKMRVSLSHWREITGYAVNVVSVDLLNKVRANLDYLLVGRFLGLEALGLYYFAFNAGLGITLNILNTLTWSLFPYLCEVSGEIKELKHRYSDTLKKIFYLIIPIVLIQAFLAPLYVPIVFGQKWVSAIPVLMLICLSALPRPFADAASMLLQTIDKTVINLYWNIIFTVIFSIALLAAAQTSISLVALAVLLTHTVSLPIFTVWASRYVFSKDTFRAII